MNAARGFTLIELLVVLVIAGLMYALVPPMIGAGMTGAELKKAARQVAAGLRQTRGEAIKWHRDTTLVLDVDARQYKIGEQSRAYKLPASVNYKVLAAKDDVVGQRAAIRFFPDGSSNGGRVTLTSGGKSLFVDVAWLTGHVAIGE